MLIHFMHTQYALPNAHPNYGSCISHSKFNMYINQNTFDRSNHTSENRSTARTAQFRVFEHSNTFLRCYSYISMV
ncbi:hypothetical protein VCRA2110O318_40050 [Vibrio crassostreae]|nr:hypothetical protein VCRA2110O318_40050 [Vibrio crassostreae]CAK2503582.1 hypothetical protein VCRA2110O319_50050 [Vibrio crassostreae]CAK2910747.1 hypothetical protein VCRA217O317_30243 [Vibrio crassostreae]